jgi:hypothetical protein
MKLSRLKRFDPSKHQQLEEFIAWCQLMGLTGKDLISLGGHLDRAQQQAEVERAKEIVCSYQLDKVGHDRAIEERFTIKWLDARFRFDNDGWDWVKITNYKTKQIRRFPLPSYNLGRMHWRKTWVYRAVLAVHYGKIQLNF